MAMYYLRGTKSIEKKNWAKIAKCCKIPIQFHIFQKKDRILQFCMLDYYDWLFMANIGSKIFWLTEIL